MTSIRTTLHPLTNPANDLPFSWPRHVRQYTKEQGGGTALSVLNYVSGFFTAIAAYFESICSNKSFPDCFRSYWDGKQTAPAPAPAETPVQIDPEQPKIEDVPPQETQSGPRYSTKRIAAGILGISALGILLWKTGALNSAAEGLSSPLGTNPPVPDFQHVPPVDPTKPLAQCSASTPDPSQIKLFTSYTQDNSERLAMSRKVMTNQMAYSAKHGYQYEVFEQNLAAGVVDHSLPYWSKISGINQLLDQSAGDDKTCWIVWLDDDAIVMDSNIQMEKFIQSHGRSDPDVHVIVTKDIPGSTDVNTGVLIVRNSEKSREFFKELWEMRHQPVYANGQYTTYGSCPNQGCLHEQQAMQDLLRNDRWAGKKYQKAVNIIPQRSNGPGLNMFERFSHWDDNRLMHLNYDNDPKESRCQSGDFICQCTGLATKGRRSWGDLPNNLRMECIDGLLAKSV